MPNWCTTKYVFVGDQQELKDLYDVMKELENLSEPLVPNDFGTSWLGCLVTKLGMDWNNISCRGNWFDLIVNEGELRFETSTAWGPCYSVMNLICEKFPSLSYFYQAIEWGNEIFETNDYMGKYFPQKYIVYFDIDGSGSDDEFFVNNKDLFVFLSKKFKTSITSMQDIETLNKRLEKKDGFCHVFKFQYP